MIMKIANRDVARFFAARAVDIDGYGSMRARNGFRDPNWSSLPPKLQKLMRERRESISGVILSYDTPIAWLDAGQWVIPAVSYSNTTGKHQSYCRRDLPGYVEIPWDCALNEYDRVMNGHAKFVHTRTGMKSVAR